jgi:two-component system chemotaxis sensor kinase CheA
MSDFSSELLTQIDSINARLGSVSGSASDDLPAMAELHTALGNFVSAAEKTLDATRVGAITTAANTGMQVLEQIVLQEVDNVTKSIAQVAQTVQQLRAIISGEKIPESPAAASGESSKSESDHAPSAVAEQAALNENDLPLVQEFIGEAAGHIESAEAGLLQLEENAANADAINTVFRGFHTIKGVAGFLNLTQIGSLAHAAENVLDLCRKGKLAFDSSVADVILQSIDAMRKLIELLAPVIAANGGAPASMPGLNQLLDRLHAVARGDKPAAATPQQQQPSKAAEPTTEAPKARAQAGDTTIKVSTERLDSLINMVGELVIAQAMVGQDMLQLAAADRRVSRNLSHLGKIARELQELSMSMRMVPIQGVFQKMTRLVRDLARKANKEIDFIVTGGETELDRNVVEAISDPLVHMVRNAADHGIETPEDREKAGKPREGKLSLRAYHQAGNIVIEITDDGKGLNKAKIVKKATENGIIKPGQELTEQEIFMLIFAAGLSTADKITDVSGRGVGMDVVRRNVESLRGRIDIQSVEGKGSTFTIRLPLTLAVIDGLVVKVGEHRYIIPITSIEQSLQPRAEQISTVQNRIEMCMVRDSLVPVLRLHRLFNMAATNDDLTKGLLVIVHNGTDRCCLLVDELLGQQQVVIKSLGASLGQIKGISGGAILGDGNVSLILDVPGLIASTSSN